MRVAAVLAVVCVLVGVAAIGAALVGSGGGVLGRDGEWVTGSCQHMATTIEVTVQGSARAEEAVAIVSEVFGAVDRDMSEWKEESPLTRVNRMAGLGEGLRVPDELLWLLRRSVELAEATEGAFDPTWAALWGLWDFKAASPVVPVVGEIERRAALVDYRRVLIDGAAGTVSLPEEGMMLGLGGIAKGYALDVAVARLREAGFEDFMIVAGGQVYASGAKTDRAWRVGVRDPRGPVDELFAVVELRDASLSTSGDYERYFEVDGRRYHHILDPRTGWPSTGLRSVTVVSSDGVLADVMSTALMVASPSRHEAIMARTGLEWALVVDDGGRVSQLGGEGGPVVTVLKEPRAE